MPKHFNILVMRLAFFLYSIYLSILLFSQDPTHWVATSSNLPEFLKILMPLAHLLSFTVLSLLTFAACFPLPRWGILLSLVIYGGTTEIIQSLIPHRTPEWADWLQDLVGISIGFVGFWLVVFCVRLMRRNKSLEVPSSS